METINVLAQPNVPGRVPFSLAKDNSVSGQYAAVQDWVIAFLTEKGSRPDHPEYGTNFKRRVTGGSIRNTTSLLSEFALAASEAVEDANNEAPEGTLTVSTATAHSYYVDMKLASFSVTVIFTFSDGSSSFGSVEVAI